MPVISNISKKAWTHKSFEQKRFLIRPGCDLNFEPACHTAARLISQLLWLYLANLSLANARFANDRRTFRGFYDSNISKEIQHTRIWYQVISGDFSWYRRCFLVGWWQNSIIIDDHQTHWNDLMKNYDYLASIERYPRSSDCVHSPVQNKKPNR